ncbi:phage tail assembly chaperone family protein, TAC [Psychrobacter sp. A3]|uniref:phage tail assembly chaperone family protein, TAC n=1 Tax=Psychrobacter sp. A3 TaxID=2992754 RepID=UPI00237ACA23|nr:phage tail assembly chaperone family protein, TAC [Psychrobacter sp. A3]MDE0490004.1 phage tail assembly chaperone family protein, TAC [Psychrobacter sp. A3]
MAKILLSDVKAGSLVDEIHSEKVEFYHKGELCEVDIMFKTLPFAISDDLHNRMNNKEDVAAEWISKALVDEDGKLQFTKKQVEDNFIQPLANAVFNKVWGLDNIKKAVEKQAPKKKKE